MLDSEEYLTSQEDFQTTQPNKPLSASVKSLTENKPVRHVGYQQTPDPGWATQGDERIHVLARAYRKSQETRSDCQHSWWLVTLADSKCTWNIICFNIQQYLIFIFLQKLNHRRVTFRLGAEANHTRIPTQWQHTPVSGVVSGKEITNPVSQSF